MPREALDAEWTLIGVLLFLIGLAAITGFAQAGPAPAGRASRAAREEASPAMAGVASWYGEGFRGRTTACGYVYDPEALTAAHRHLPCATRLRVEHAGRSVTVVVTDRGPFVEGRFLDLSRGAFRRLAPLGRGLIGVRARVIDT